MKLKNNIKKFFLLLLVIGVYTTSCNSPAVVAKSVNTTIPATQPITTFIPSVTATISPTSIPNVCSHIEKQYEPFKMPLSWETLFDIDGTNWEEAYKFLRDFELSVVHYLSFHSTHEQLVQDLSEIEGVYSLDIKSVDLDLDGEQEIIIGVEFRKNGLFFLTFIAKCIRDQYIYFERARSSVYDRDPQILSTEDINGDGLPDAVIVGTSVGNDSQPFMSIINWSNEKQDFISIFQKDKVPLGDVQIEIKDIDHDGLNEITFYGRLNHTGDLSMMVTYTYAWDGQFYKQIKEEIIP